MNKEKRLPFTPSKKQLLAGAIGLALSSGSFMAQAQESGNAQLQSTRVETESEQGFKVDKADSFKYSQPLIDTPKSLTIISSSVMKDRGIDNLRDALRSVPGISMAAGEGGTPTGDSIVIRGFSARTDVFIDGIRDVAGYSRDTYNTEAIEISKGPGSSISGRGSVGGSVNLIRKRARAENFNDIGITAGSESNYRLTLDSNTQIGQTSAIRVNVASMDGGVAGRDEVENGMNAVALSFATGLDTATRFNLSAEYQDQDRLPDYGLPWVSNYSDRTDRVFLEPISQYAGGPPPVPYSNFYGNVHRDFEEIKATGVTARFEQDLSENSMIFVQAKVSSVDRHSITTAPRFTSETIDDVRYYGPSDIRWDDEKTRDQETTMKALQIAYVATLGSSITHDIAIGTEYYTEMEERWNESDNGTDELLGTVNSLTNPNPFQGYTGRYTRTGEKIDGEGTTLAFYAFDTISFSSKWELSAGLRYENYESVTHPTWADPSFVLKRDDDMLSWNLAVVYKVRENGSIYLATGTSFNPAAEDLTASSRGNEIDLDPEESTSIELGTKWNLFDDRLLATAAIFRTVKDNARSDDPFDGGTATDQGSDTRADILEGEQQITGLELSAFGQITSELSIMAGYTFQDSEIVKATGADGEAGFEGEALARTPENAFSLWANYELDKLSFGLGAEYVDVRYNSSSPGGREKAPDYLLFDAMAAYQFNDAFSIQLNGNNLTDEDYIDLVGGGHFVPGPGRYFSLSANLSF